MTIEFPMGRISAFSISSLLRIAFFLVFDFLWETRKTETFLARKIQEIQEISQHNLIVLLNFYVTFFGNFLEIQEMFLIFDQIFKIIAFLCNNFFRNLRFEAKFQKFSLLTMLLSAFLSFINFLFFLPVFLVRNFLS